MGRVSFVWELGGGYGHLVRYRGLIERLVAQGHQVDFHAAAETRARQIYADLPIQVRKAPRGYTPPEHIIRRPNSFAEVLWNSGYSEADALRWRIRYWRAMFEADRPDVVIADYAPSAVLACGTLGLRCIASGNGFYVPPALSPLPAYRSQAAPAPQRDFEGRLLAVLNAAGEGLGARRLQSVVEGILPSEVFLLTFAEFDPQPRPVGTEYLGAWPSQGVGSPPTFPEGGKKIFCYVDVNKLPDAFMTELRQANVSALIVGRGGLALPQDFLSSANVNVSADIVDLPMAAALCQAGITSGALNSTLALLLAGKPVLALPTNLEQFLNARHLERLGAGLSAPAAAPGNLAAKLGAVLADHDLHRGARRFAERYAGESSATAADRMLARLDLP